MIAAGLPNAMRIPTYVGMHYFADVFDRRPDGGLRAPRARSGGGGDRPFSNFDCLSSSYLTLRAPAAASRLDFCLFGKSFYKYGLLRSNKLSGSARSCTPISSVYPIFLPAPSTALQQGEAYEQANKSRSVGQRNSSRPKACAIWTSEHTMGN